MHYTIEKRNSRIRSIEVEFGESITEIVAGFREMGYSYRDTAGALDVPYSTFIKWEEELGFSDGKTNWRNGEYPNSLTERAMRLGYTDIESMICQLRHSGKSRIEIGVMLGCHPASLWKHTPQEAKYLDTRTQKQTDARREVMSKMNENRRKARGGV